MKKLIFITFATLLLSCEEQNVIKYEKPFIIIDKGAFTTDRDDYTFQDKNGYKKSFSDAKGKYSVGDTLK